MKSKQLYNGRYNWQGEIHTLWTHASSQTAAHRQFIAKLVKVLGFSGYRLRCHFNGYLDNYKIKAKEKNND